VKYKDFLIVVEELALQVSAPALQLKSIDDRCVLDANYGNYIVDEHGFRGAWLARGE
jgi:hypothetical protein